MAENEHTDAQPDAPEPGKLAEPEAATTPAEPASVESEASAAEEPAAAAEPPAEPESPVAEETVPAEETAPAEADAAAADPKRKRKRLPRRLRPQKTRPRRPAPAGARPAIVRPPKPQRERGRRQERRGVVVSDSMDKTIVVEVDVIASHPRYKKVIRRSVKFHAHDERNAAKVGDVVRIVETRPRSATKRWRLAEILEQAR
jgi:small subunit ribosomal protein S17